MEAVFVVFNVLCHSSTKEEREEAKKAEKLGLPVPKAPVEYKSALINLNHIEGVVPVDDRQFHLDMVSGVSYTCKGKIEDYFDIT